MTKYEDIGYCLCDRLRNGDEEAYTLLFNKYGRLLYVLAYRFLKSEEDAEDAVQYAFMKIWEERKKLDFSDGVRSLLYTVLKNYVLNELRHRNVVFEKHYMLAQDEKDCISFVEDMEKRNLLDILRSAIERLPPQKSIICKLKLNEGLTNQEISDRLNIEVITVKSHYTQAIKMLRAKFMILISFIITCV